MLCRIQETANENEGTEGTERRRPRTQQRRSPGAPQNYQSLLLLHLGGRDGTFCARGITEKGNRSGPMAGPTKALGDIIFAQELVAGRYSGFEVFGKESQNGKTNNAIVNLD